MVTRGECGFSSLMKYKKKGKITLSFTSPGKKIFLYIYDVITSSHSFDNHFLCVVLNGFD
jgi:hypothetical protein